MRRWVWASAIVAPVMLIGGWLLAQTRQPDRYNSVRDTISALAAHGAASPWIMTISLAGVGVSYLLTAVGLSDVGGAARSMLALGGVATIVVAASPQPAAAHVPAAGVAFVALALWPVLAVGTIGRLGAWLSAGLLGLLVWFAVELQAGDVLGLSERVLTTAQALTPIVVVFAVRRGARIRT